MQKLTGRPISEVITDKILNRAGLRKTYWPGVGDRGIRQPHAQGYLPDPDTMQWTNITRLDPSIAWAAGQMIATPSDINRFLVALQDGKLVKPATLAQMRNGNRWLPAGDAMPDLLSGRGRIRAPRFRARPQTG